MEKMDHTLVRNELQRAAKTYQNEAWISAVDNGREKGRTKVSNTNTVSTCIAHFHFSVITRDPSDQGTLKVEEAPTIFMSKFGMENDQCVDEKSLSRIVGLPEDMQYIYNYGKKSN